MNQVPRRRCPCGGEMVVQPTRNIEFTWIPDRYCCPLCKKEINLHSRAALQATFALGFLALCLTLIAVWELYVARAMKVPDYIPQSELIRGLVSWADSVLVLFGLFIAVGGAIMMGIGFAGLAHEARHPVIYKDKNGR